MFTKVILTLVIPAILTICFLQNSEKTRGDYGEDDLPKSAAPRIRFARFRSGILILKKTARKLFCLARSEAIVCYKCDSLSLAECAMALDGTDLPYEDCKGTLSCIMSIVDSVTYRGCGSSTPIIGATYQKTCSDNLCNRGVYPPGRLKCYHCTGAECVPAQPGKPIPCLYHHEEDECYTNIVDATTAQRGCRSDTNSSNSESTKFCDINGCNNQAGVATLQCVECDSQKRRGCKMDLFESFNSLCNITLYDTCEVHSLLTRPETCFLYHNKDRVMRGCSRDLPEDLVQDMEHLFQCNNATLCNARCLKQQSCLDCNSMQSPQCRLNTTDVRSSTCGSAEASSCYACEFHTSHVQRGCGIPLSGTDVQRCYECDSADGCNSIPFTRCYQCSSLINQNCANWEKPGDVNIELCAREGASCVIGVFDDGHTLRGCESEHLQCNETLPNCFQCEGSFCNKGIYPLNRLRCYQCNGSDNECVDNSYEAVPCSGNDLIPLGQQEACFEFFDRNGTVVRGCRSNPQLYYDCLLNQQLNPGTGCKVCYEDGCNGTPFQRELVNIAGITQYYPVKEDFVSARPEVSVQVRRSGAKKINHGIVLWLAIFLLSNS